MVEVAPKLRSHVSHAGLVAPRGRLAHGWGWIQGHIWTLLPHLRSRRLERAPRPMARRWSTTLQDPQVGRVSLFGWYEPLPDSDALVLIVHGLGGTADRAYCRMAADAVAAEGYSSLRISLRGAEGTGGDFHHAGLTADIEAALASPEVQAYRRIFLLGYSLGGQLVLHAASQNVDMRLNGVAAICPPLDLAAGQRAIDRPGSWLYRRHLLRGLNSIYAAVAEQRELPTPASVVRRSRTLREWDSLAVVPRFGFADVDAYYREASVGPRLGQISCPALLVLGRYDPMIPAWMNHPMLRHASTRTTVCELPIGGHVFFPRSATLGLLDLDVRGVESAIVRWFRAID